LSWERYADLSHEKKITSQVCREHHPKYQHWQKVHIKPVEEHEKEARAKEDLNSFVWALEGEHEGAVVHQCQILDRIAEFGQVWVKWTSTGKIMCIPRSNIDKPTQGRGRKRSVVSNVEKNPKKQRKEIATGNALSPVLLLTDTPPTPPYSRKTRSSGAKRDDGKSAKPGGLQPVTRQLQMMTPVQQADSTTNATTKNKKRTVPAKKANATKNTDVADETMMSELLDGTADDEIGTAVSGATVEVTAETTIEVTVDDENAEVNRKLRTIEDLDLMEKGDGGDSDEEGFELDYHNDAVRKRVTLCNTSTDATNITPVSDDDLDIEYIDDSVGEAWWHMRRPGATILGAPDGWSPPGILENWSGYKPRDNSGAPTEEDIDNPGNWNLYSYTPVYDKKNYVHHKTPAGAIVLPKHPPDGERKVGDWTFHYNGWWPSEFDRETYVRGSATYGNLKPLDRMGCLDVDVLKKHGLNANRVKNDPLFFFTLMFPICPPSRIEGDKCISVNGVEGDTRMPYFSTLAQFTNVYASMSDSGSGMGHEWHPTSTTELVHWSGLDGRPHTIHARWQQNDP